jgi:hypothetical protein
VTKTIDAESESKLEGERKSCVREDTSTAEPLNDVGDTDLEGKLEAEADT